MGRVANPYTRVTEVASFVNAGWKEFWMKSIESGSKKQGTQGIVDILAQKCVEFAKQPHSADEWKSLLAAHTALSEVERIGRESTDFGKAVHSVVEAFLLNQPTPTTITLHDKFKKEYTRAITEREMFSGGLLIKWCKEAKVKPLTFTGATGIEMPGVEVALQDEDLFLTGHPDLVCTFGDDPTVWIVDWKTSKEMRLEYNLQLAAYAKMIKKQFGVQVNAGVIVRVPSDPNAEKQFETHTVHNLDQYFEAFLSCLDAMKFFTNKGRWKELKQAA